MKKRGPVQKLVIGLAILSYIAAVACGAAALFIDHGDNSPVFTSLLASVVFFVGVGVVLQVFGTANLPSFKVD